GSRILERSSEIVAAVHACVLGFGGSISAEHGVGKMKRDELAATRPKAATETMRAIKLALDPLGIMNPGRVISVD
ncbi:MAG: FAD-linked oxidase C-terminal domain-containing protein, partial [Hyphomonadaceae bacterium]